MIDKLIRLVSRNNQFIQYCSYSSSKMSQTGLCKKTISFKSIHGKPIELEAVYEDSGPNESSLGTVVAFHGSPGSHKDFKYVKEKLDELSIRFIGLNYPGFNFTPPYENQDFSNSERQLYTNALIDELNIKGKIIFMGHSRGCENALITAVDKNAHGLVMINPIGFRRHKGISPKSNLESVESMYNAMPTTVANFMIFKVYKRLGFKVSNPIECINALRTMNRCYLEKQLEYVEKLNDLDTKLFYIFAGNDHLMEKEIMFESLEHYKGICNFEFTESVTDDDVNRISQSFSDGKGASVYFEKDNHFQNKTRADLIAKCSKAIFEGSNSKLINKL